MNEMHPASNALHNVSASFLSDQPSHPCS